jgi:hypothetical protein
VARVVTFSRSGGVFMPTRNRSTFASTTVWLNGAPAGRLEVAGGPAVMSLVVEDGRVTRVYLVRNPRKVTRLDDLAR